MPAPNSQPPRPKLRKISNFTNEVLLPPHLGDEFSPDVCLVLMGGRPRIREVSSTAVDFNQNGECRSVYFTPAPVPRNRWELVVDSPFDTGVALENFNNHPCVLVAVGSPNRMRVAVIGAYSIQQNAVLIGQDRVTIREVYHFRSREYRTGKAFSHWPLSLFKVRRKHYAFTFMHYFASVDSVREMIFDIMSYLDDKRILYEFGQEIMQRYIHAQTGQRRTDGRL